MHSTIMYLEIYIFICDRHVKMGQLEIKIKALQALFKPVLAGHAVVVLMTRLHVQLLHCLTTSLQASSLPSYCAVFFKYILLCGNCGIG